MSFVAFPLRRLEREPLCHEGYGLEDTTAKGKENKDKRGVITTSYANEKVVSYSFQYLSIPTHKGSLPVVEIEMVLGMLHIQNSTCFKPNPDHGLFQFNVNTLHSSTIVKFFRDFISAFKKTKQNTDKMVNFVGSL